MSLEEKRCPTCERPYRTERATVTVAAAVSRDIADTLRDCAEREGRSMSSVVGEMIVRGLEHSHSP